MDTKNKYGPFGREMLIRYLKGELSPEDSWKIEKAMLEDPLLSEAMEGLEGIPDKDLIGRDVEELEQRVHALSAKGKSRSLPGLVRIAAAFLILSVSTYIIFQLTRNKPEDTAGIAMQTPDLEKDTGTTSTYSDAGVKKTEETVVTPGTVKKDSEKPEKLREKPPAADFAAGEEPEEEIISGPDREKSEIQNQPVMSEIATAGAGNRTGDTTIFNRPGEVSGYAIAADEAKPAKLSDYILKEEGALSRDRETTRQVKTNKAAKAALSEETVTVSYIEPRPLNGDSSYVNYIRTSLRYPDMATRNNIQGDVILRFSVGADSSIFNISVISGPGAGCNEEALRLVREGPKWAPAISNGFPVKSDVYYKIPFRVIER